MVRAVWRGGEWHVLCNWRRTETKSLMHERSRSLPARSL